MTNLEKYNLIRPYLGRLFGELVAEEDRGDNNPCAFDFETFGDPRFYRGSVPFPTIDQFYAKYTELVNVYFDQDVLATRRDAYNYHISPDAITEALFEAVAENRPQKLQALQAIRESIKLQYPKADE